MATSCLSFFPFVNHVSAEVVNQWETGTNAYPLDVEDQSCATYLGYIYCVGGLAAGSNLSAIATTNAVYYAPVSSSGVGAWTGTTSYPTDLSGHSCVTYHGYIYCVGGFSDNSTSLEVYYAAVSSSGVGAWNSTSSYPMPIIEFLSCATYLGYIYCVGGTGGSVSCAGTRPTNEVYYAPLSSFGVGAWTSTSSYPTCVANQQCATSSGYIYCVGGLTGYNSTSKVFSYTNDVYYAPVSASGVGDWTNTTSYPATSIDEQSCATYSAYIYCAGGFEGPTTTYLTNAVYYAPVSSSGVGAWTSTSSYPTGTIFGDLVRDVPAALHLLRRRRRTVHLHGAPAPAASARRIARSTMPRCRPKPLQARLRR